MSENEIRSTEEFRDLMSYCRPRWVSDWLWNRFAETVRTHSSPASLLAPASGTSLSGYVEANGAARWALVPGELTELDARVTAARRARVWGPGGTSTLPLSVIPSSHGDLVEVVVTLPSSPLPGHVEVTVDGAVYQVDLSTIKKY